MRRDTLYAPRSFVLINRPSLVDEQVHQGLERPGLHHPDLQRPDRLVVRPASPVHVIQLLLHRNAAVLEHLAADLENGIVCRRRRMLLDLPVKDIVAWDRRRVSIARVLHKQRPVGLQELLGNSDALVEILFIRLVIVDAQDNVPPADEPELGHTVVEPRHLEHVPDSVSIQP